MFKPFQIVVVFKDGRADRVHPFRGSDDKARGKWREVLEQYDKKELFLDPGNKKATRCEDLSKGRVRVDMSKVKVKFKRKKYGEI